MRTNRNRNQHPTDSRALGNAACSSQAGRWFDPNPTASQRQDDSDRGADFGANRQRDASSRSGWLSETAQGWRARTEIGARAISHTSGPSRIDVSQHAVEQRDADELHMEAMLISNESAAGPTPDPEAVQKFRHLARRVTME
jgi:hypothetical protein